MNREGALLLVVSDPPRAIPHARGDLDRRRLRAFPSAMRALPACDAAIDGGGASLALEGVYWVPVHRTRAVTSG